MHDVLVAISHHRAATVPTPVAHDVHLGSHESVRGAHDRADVEVVLPVLDGHVEVVATGVEVGDDRLHAPIAISINYIAPIPITQEGLVVLLTDWPLTLPRPESDNILAVGHGVIRRPLLIHTRKASHEVCWTGG